MSKEINYWHSPYYLRWYGMDGTVEEVDMEKIRAIFEVNVFATINVTRYALPYLRKQRSGHIISISSVAGFVGAPGWSIYRYQVRCHRLFRGAGIGC